MALTSWQGPSSSDLARTHCHCNSNGNARSHWNTHTKSPRPLLNRLNMTGLAGMLKSGGCPGPGARPEGDIGPAQPMWYFPSIMGISTQEHAHVQKYTIIQMAHMRTDDDDSSSDSDSSATVEPALARLSVPRCRSRN